jgi:hypothetical protein
MSLRKCASTFIILTVLSGPCLAQTQDIPSGDRNAPYIPVGSTQGGTTVGVSVPVGSSGNVPTINGGGVAVSTPVGSGSTVGVGASTSSSGNTVGVGASTTFP